MLDASSEARWKEVKERWPDAIVFQEADDLLAVKDRDAEIVASEFGIKTSSSWLAFDHPEAVAYMTGLVYRGYQVVRASAHRAQRFKPASERTRELERQRAKSRFAGLEPRLVFDPSDLDIDTERWLRRNGDEELFDRFKFWLRRDDWPSIRQYGELYVYPVGDWYEVDWELTTMRGGHALLLAKAALDVGAKLACRVVDPKPYRGRRPRRKPARVPAPDVEPTRQGQLGFGDLLASW